MSQRVRTIFVWVLLTIAMFAIYQLVSSDDDGRGVPDGSLAQLEADLGQDNVRAVAVDDDYDVHVTTVNGEYRVREAWDASLAESLEIAGIVPTSVRSAGSRPAGPSGWWIAVVAVLLGVGAFLWFLRRAGANNQTIFALRKTTARLVADVPKIGWDDVGGADEAKRSLRDTLDFLRHPQRWERAGARLPRGVLLEGPPGYGKTLLAKALAGEAKLPFFEVSASEFVELFVGVGAARVRDLFDEARKKSPCVIFIDELDAVGRKRGSASASLTHQEREQALDQLLVCMDGFRPRDRVVVVAATNRADVLDPALLRPGRFDMVLRVGDFDHGDRLEVLRVHTKHKPLAKDVDLAEIAARTDGMSGAELEQICNRAAMTAARREGEPVITQEDLIAALAARAARAGDVDRLDLVLAEANAAISRPASSLRVELTLRDGRQLDGDLVWADPVLLKLRTADGGLVVSRAELSTVRALDTSGERAIDAYALENVARPEEPATA